MIDCDLHLHTKYSHGCATPKEMYEAGLAKGLHRMGFSEHSPRPLGFNYTHEYRDSLTKHLPNYVQEVCNLRDHPSAAIDGKPCAVLFGMEMDWLEGELDFATRSAKAFDFDYLIGSVHFIGHWGFDDGRGPWEKASQEDCEGWYRAYFSAWQDMLACGLYNIAAHPDLIKIFSVEQFHLWLQKPESQGTIRHCLETLKAKGMAMEISSAGLRKECREIYPCPEIMQMARELALPVTFASDAHNVHDIAYGFDELARYARSFGFTEHGHFERGRWLAQPIPEV
ncbi:MAG: histidinol-phosphatase [Desulfovibrio sp.]|nr:histidinol-phosphatase [Desulfovibrio sp.]